MGSDDPTPHRDAGDRTTRAGAPRGEAGSGGNQTQERAIGGVGGLERYVPRDERILIVIRPSRLFVVLRPLGALLALAIVGIAGLWVSRRFGWVAWGRWIGAMALVSAMAILAWRSIDRLARVYVLTESRVLRVVGVLRQRVVDARVGAIQHVLVHRSIRERVFGLGSIGFATAGTGGVEIVWAMVSRPADLLDQIRSTLGSPPAIGDDHREAASGTDEGSGPDGRNESSSRVPVIGLTGGIGAGKSAVASALGRLGCTVIDSDRLAKEALDRSDVRERLIQWWGPEVIGTDGRVDRAAVARIVFDDDRQRRRLERLVHPIIRVSRERMQDLAREAGSKAVVIDAPLLLEAGLDADCDAVVFVDADEQARLARVGEARGWNAAELARREKAQWGLELKRQRSEYVIRNVGGRDDLDAQVRRTLSQILRRTGPEGRA